MGSLKNILIHCQENEKKFKEIMPYELDSDDANLTVRDGRLLNYGWIQALKFIQRNFDVEFNTIEEEEE